MHFGSDNCAPAHPAILEVLAAANDGSAASYGGDGLMEHVRDILREIFEAPDAEVFLVATGTQANALALATYAKPWQKIFCHELAHINVDECGAPEFFSGGAKLAGLQGEHAKIDATTLERAITDIPKDDVHVSQPGPVSISNLTERGAVYQPEEIKAISDVCSTNGLALHLDGARFANGVIATGKTPAEMSWQSGVDILSFGGTKNGLLGVEAVILFDPSKAWEFELRRKRGGALISKHRYLSAQMDAYLTNNLWLNMAGHANSMAQALAHGIVEKGGRIVHPTDANMVFATLPLGSIERLEEAGMCYGPASVETDENGEKRGLGRFICSWATKKADIDDFLALV